MTKKSKKIIYVILSCSLFITVWYAEKNFNHQGEWHSIGIADLGMVDNRQLERLDAGTLTADNEPIVEKIRSFTSGSREVNVKIPEEIDFM